MEEDGDRRNEIDQLKYSILKKHCDEINAKNKAITEQLYQMSRIIARLQNRKVSKMAKLKLNEQIKTIMIL